MRELQERYLYPQVARVHKHLFPVRSQNERPGARLAHRAQQHAVREQVPRVIERYVHHKLQEVTRLDLLLMWQHALGARRVVAHAARRAVLAPLRGARLVHLFERAQTGLLQLAFSGLDVCRRETEDALGHCTRPESVADTRKRERQLERAPKKVG